MGSRLNGRASPLRLLPGRSRSSTTRSGRARTSTKEHQLKNIKREGMPPCPRTSASWPRRGAGRLEARSPLVLAGRLHSPARTSQQAGPGLGRDRPRHRRTTTSTGDLVASIVASVSTWERRMIAMRTREGLAEANGVGMQVGSPILLPVEVQARVATDRRAGRT